MKQNSIKKRAVKRAKLDEIDPLDDLDVKRLKLVGRGPGWDANPKEGKRRARQLSNRINASRPSSRKRRGA